ncbi:MAG: hypothetical protein JNN04_06730 [Cyclobacteriaceae bacterium]|nr:hypothetical protein [Cyclobacteriaceae bacterium]
MTKTRKAKKKSGTEKTGKESRETPREQPDEASKKFDFGGLPDRNLKKNLGC